MSAHVHRARPSRRTVDMAPSRAARAGRCYFAPGDEAAIEDFCRCGAWRRTPAVMVAPAGHVDGHPLGSLDAKATGAPGAWIGGAL